MPSEMPSKPITLFRITMSHCGYVLARGGPRAALSNFVAQLNSIDGIDPAELFTAVRVTRGDITGGLGGDGSWVLNSGPTVRTVESFLADNPTGQEGQE